jgi:hypothetical protein
VEYFEIARDSVWTASLCWSTRIRISYMTYTLAACEWEMSGVDEIDTSQTLSLHYPETNNPGKSGYIIFISEVRVGPGGCPTLSSGNRSDGSTLLSVAKTITPERESVKAQRTVTVARRLPVGSVGAPANFRVCHSSVGS